MRCGGLEQREGPVGLESLPRRFFRVGAKKEGRVLPMVRIGDSYLPPLTIELLLANQLGQHFKLEEVGQSHPIAPLLSL